MNKQSK